MLILSHVRLFATPKIITGDHFQSFLLCTHKYESKANLKILKTYLGWTPQWCSLVVKNLPAVQKTWVWFLDLEDPLEKERANHSSILAWKILWTEEPGGLQSTGLKTVRHACVTNTHPSGYYYALCVEQQQRGLMISVLCEISMNFCFFAGWVIPRKNHGDVILKVLVFQYSKKLVTIEAGGFFFFLFIACF